MAETDTLLGFHSEETPGSDTATQDLHGSGQTYSA